MNRSAALSPMPRRLLIWSVMPTHHQSAFFAALRESGIDLIVHYYGRLSADRRRMGWTDFAELPAGERYVRPGLSALRACTDWRERIHVVPGYSHAFLPVLALRLTAARVPWLHWSEPSRPKHRLAFAPALRRLYGALVRRGALGALAIGDMARRDFVRWGIPEDRIRYLPYSIAALESPADPPTQRGAPRFLFAGALCHRKGIDILLAAFSQVHRHYPAATLDLVGPDESRGGYRQLAADLGILDVVRFLPPRPATAMAATFADCDVFVLPSRFDGWGVVLNEATSLGKAIVATDTCGAAHHLLREGENGFRVPAEDVEALAGCLQRYCDDRSLAARHGARSRRLFTDLSPARNASRLASAITDLERRLQPVRAVAVRAQRK